MLSGSEEHVQNHDSRLAIASKLEEGRKETIKVTIRWGQQEGAGLGVEGWGVVSWRWGLSHVSTGWWGEAQWRCEDTVLRERLQTCSDPAAYVVTEAAAEKAIKEVKGLEDVGLCLCFMEWVCSEWDLLFSLFQMW